MLRLFAILALASGAFAAKPAAFEPLPGYPLDFTKFLEGGDIEGGVVVEDMEDSGQREIVFGASDGMVHLLDERGEERRDGLWPRHLPAPIVGRVTTAKIDDSGEMRVLVGCLDGKIYCLSREGDVLWSRTTGSTGYDGTPIVTELAPGAKPSIVVRSHVGQLLGLEGNGFLDWTFRAPGPGAAAPRVIDPAGQGERRVLISDDEGINYLVDDKGKEALKFPTRRAVGGRRQTTVSAADLDGGGALGYVSDFPEKMEVSREPQNSTFRDLSGPRDRDFLYHYNPAGELAARVPRSSKRIQGGILVGDLLRSGEAQVIYSEEGGTIHVTDQNGNAQDGWPRTVQSIYKELNDPFLQTFADPVMGKPMLVDVDGDGAKDLLVGLNDRAGRGIRSGMLMALAASGRPIDGAPVYVGRHKAPAHLADLDGDTRLDLVVPGGIGGTGPQLHAFRLRTFREVRMQVLETHYALVEEETW